MMMPRTWVKAVTYPPKIEAVKDGRCRQTIREVRRTDHHGRYVIPSRGDALMLHGWEGRPYRSKWSWRRAEICTYVQTFHVYEDGIATTFPIDGIPRPKWWKPGPQLVYVYWWDDLKELAKQDFIDPPNGWALKCVLKIKNKKGQNFEGEPYYILRW